MNGRIIKILRREFLKKFGRPATKHDMKVAKKEYLKIPKICK